MLVFFFQLEGLLVGNVDSDFVDRRQHHVFGRDVDIPAVTKPSEVDDRLIFVWADVVRGEGDSVDAKEGEEMLVVTGAVPNTWLGAGTKLLG